MVQKYLSCRTAGRKPKPRRSAFSMVELLVVIAIIALLTLLSMPAFEQMVKSSRVTMGGRAIIDELILAQQTALSRSMPVEVRFYKLPALNQPPTSAPAAYRAVQAFYVENTGLKPLGKVLYLPPGLSIVEDAAKSSLLAESGGPLIDPTEHPGDMSLPNYGTNYRFRSFRFRTNGETDMTDAPAFITLAMQHEKTVSGDLPANFLTLQIDPVSGRVRVFRP